MAEVFLLTLYHLQKYPIRCYTDGVFWVNMLLDDLVITEG